MKRVLIIAYHFPPQSGSSGFLRALKFSRYLLDDEWQSVVLTVNTRAYERLDQQQVAKIPREVSVLRAFALDTKKHLSIRGRHLRWFALPDRWVSWCLGAIPAGWYAVRKKQIDVILTTFPIATAVLIGLVLHRLTGKPWIIDFRDSMTEEEYPRDYWTRKVCRWIEKQAMKYGSRFIFTAESAREMYLKRYPWLAPDKCVVIHNGYDEEDFSDFGPPELERGRAHPLRLLHSGLLYPDDRDPRPFFSALARLKREGRVAARDVRIDLRASGYESYYSEIIQELGIDDLVHLLPALPYDEALQESVLADGLLIFQAASCNHQIPAKVYEYLRVGRPVLALTPEDGDSARLLREVGGATICDLADEDALYLTLPRFFESVSNGDHSLPDRQKVKRYTRKNQAHELAGCLQQVVGFESNSDHKETDRSSWPARMKQKEL